jgi:uncharacterized cupin superfamily protein
MSHDAHPIRTDNLEWESHGKGSRIGCRRKPLTVAAGGSKLGCSLYELTPGKRSWPYHYHHGNEEAIYVLEGQGTLRLAKREHAIRAGDYVALPVGPGGAHQVVNTSSRTLRYLCVSTMIEPDITVYPESRKVGLYAGAAPGGRKEDRTLHVFLRSEPRLDYWDGEA